MKKLFLILLSCYCATSFAQNGFFLQPEIGGGFSNANIIKLQFSPRDPGQGSVSSYQGQLNIGYRAGNWQFISGIGYLRTGVHFQKETIYNLEKSYVPSNIVFVDILTPFIIGSAITDYNPHFILPVKVGYEVCHFSKKLSLQPVMGAELLYNMPRTFILDQSLTNTESAAEFNKVGDRFGVMGIAQLNLEYRLNNRYDITAGPSVHYMFSSLLNFTQEHDYAVLMNLGLKWNFKKRNETVKL